MTPKEKAIQLLEQYDVYPLTYHWKKECALIAVEEVISGIESMLWQTGTHNETDYWTEVKQEIEKL